jgi:hypothetical protein
MPSSSQMATVNKVARAATAAGFNVTRSQAKGRLSLNITRNPDLYEYIAHFRANHTTGFFQWHFAQHILDGEDRRIFTMKGLMEGLSNASTIS